MRAHKTFEEIVDSIPSTWTCIRCNTEFDNFPGPTQEIPEAFEKAFDPTTGRHYHAGDICRRCYRGG